MKNILNFDLQLFNNATVTPTSLTVKGKTADITKYTLVTTQDSAISGEDEKFVLRAMEKEERCADPEVTVSI